MALAAGKILPTRTLSKRSANAPSALRHLSHERAAVAVLASSAWLAR